MSKIFIGRKSAERREQEEYATLESQKAVEEAAAYGGTVVYPTDRQLQLDVDSNEALDTLAKNIETVDWLLGVSYYEIEPSRSPDKFHVTVTMVKPLQSNMERVLLQACLGSDPKRELLSYARILKRDPHPTLFIEGGTKPNKEETEELL